MARLVFSPFRPEKRAHWTAISTLPPEAFLGPRVAMHVVAVLFPEAGGVGGAELDAADPFGAFPEVEARDESAQGPAVFGGDFFAVPLIGEDAVFGDEFFQRHVDGEAGFAVAHDVARGWTGLGAID